MRISNLIARLENATLNAASKVGPALKDAKVAASEAKLEYKARRAMRRAEEEQRVIQRVGELLIERASQTTKSE